MRSFDETSLVWSVMELVEDWLTLDGEDGITCCPSLRMASFSIRSLLEWMQLFRRIHFTEPNDKQLLIDVTLSIDRRQRFYLRNAKCSAVNEELVDAIETKVECHQQFTY